MSTTPRLARIPRRKTSYTTRSGIPTPARPRPTGLLDATVIDLLDYLRRRLGAREATS
jgi:hypothetical protein